MGFDPSTQGAKRFAPDSKKRVQNTRAVFALPWGLAWFDSKQWEKCLRGLGGICRFGMPHIGPVGAWGLGQQHPHLPRTALALLFLQSSCQGKGKHLAVK